MNLQVGAAFVFWGTDSTACEVIAIHSLTDSRGSLTDVGRTLTQLFALQM